MTITQILIGDGSSLAAFGAETLLRQRPDTQVSIAACASDLLQMARDQEPDIVLVGDQLDPALDTLELVEQLLHTAPSTRLILIGAMSDGLMIQDVLALGVRGYLFTGDDLREVLLTAVDTVLRDRPYLSPTANAEYLVALQTGACNWQLDAESRAVLRLLAQGYTVGQIALERECTLRRVYWVRQKLRRRFGAVTNEHLIQRAVEEGFNCLHE